LPTPPNKQPHKQPHKQPQTTPQTNGGFSRSQNRTAAATLARQVLSFSETIYSLARIAVKPIASCQISPNRGPHCDIATETCDVASIREKSTNKANPFFKEKSFVKTPNSGDTLTDHYAVGPDDHSIDLAVLPKTSHHMHPTHVNRTTHDTRTRGPRKIPRKVQKAGKNQKNRKVRKVRKVRKEEETSTKHRGYG
jgi:hypothetical protein